MSGVLLNVTIPTRPFSRKQYIGNYHRRTVRLPNNGIDAFYAHIYIRTHSYPAIPKAFLRLISPKLSRRFLLHTSMILQFSPPAEVPFELVCYFRIVVRELKSIPSTMRRESFFTLKRCHVLN